MYHYLCTKNTFFLHLSIFSHTLKYTTIVFIPAVM